MVDSNIIYDFFPLKNKTLFCDRYRVRKLEGLRWGCAPDLETQCSSLTWMAGVQSPETTMPPSRGCISRMLELGDVAECLIQIVQFRLWGHKCWSQCPSLKSLGEQSVLLNACPLRYRTRNVIAIHVWTDNRITLMLDIRDNFPTVFLPVHSFEDP